MARNVLTWPPWTSSACLVARTWRWVCSAIVLSCCNHYHQQEESKQFFIVTTLLNLVAHNSCIVICIIIIIDIIAGISCEVPQEVWSRFLWSSWFLWNCGSVSEVLLRALNVLSKQLPFLKFVTCIIYL